MYCRSTRTHERAATHERPRRFLHTIDGISTWVGKAAAWLIVVLMTVVCVEVFKRYIMNMPTAWIFDADNMLYGTLFMLCGAYTLAQNAHVRGDFLYSSMRPRTQAWLDLVLYIVSFYSRHRRADLCGLPTTPPNPGASRAFERDGGTARRSSTSRSSSRSPARW